VIELKKVISSYF